MLNNIYVLRSVTIKGAADQEAVLCTGKATFALKHVETTNTLYMVPGGDSSSQLDGDKVCVKATAAAHMELTQMAPQLKDLEAALQVTGSKSQRLSICQTTCAYRRAPQRRMPCLL